MIAYTSSGERLTCFGRVGGAVGENNFKYFIQFTGYTALYCAHILVVMAIYVAKQKRAEVRWTLPSLTAPNIPLVLLIIQFNPHELTVHDIG